MIDPARHDIPEVVLDLLEVIESSMREAGAPDPTLGALQLTSMVLRNWGGIQAYVAAPNSDVTPRFIAEIRIWGKETVQAMGADEELAENVAAKVAADVQMTFAGVVLYLPRDRWTFRADLSRRFNGHNMVELCREFNLGTAYFYKLIYEERNSGPKLKKSVS